MNRPRRTQKRANDAPAPAPTAPKRRRGGAGPAATGRKPRAAETAVAPESEDAPSESDDVDTSEEEEGEGNESQAESYDPRKSNVVASRRGAPAHTDKESVVSVATLQPQSNRHSQEALDGEYSQEPREGEHGRVDDSMRQVMQLSLPDLAREARQLITQLEAPERQNLVWKRLCMLRRKGFYATREVYEQPPGFPFIDGQLLSDFGQRSTQGQIILGQANLASVLDIVESIQFDENFNILEGIAALDDFSHKLFSEFGDKAKNLELSLNIRTLRLIEELAAQKPKGGINALLASVLCEPIEMHGKIDYPHLFANGPFRPIGHREEDAVADACHDRIVHILQATKKDKKNNGLKALRETFPNGKILEELRDWVLKIYRQSLATVEASQFQTGPGALDVYYDANEQLRQEESQSQDGSTINRFSGPQQYVYP